jgi:capsid protein
VAEQHSFGALQQLVRQEALVAGDVLIVVKQFQATRLPRIQIINGAKVQTPLGRYELPNGNRIVWGVELDSQNRQVAYHVVQPDGTSQRIASYGTKTGRRSAWLVYGTDKRLDDVRGRPILSLVLQSIKEIDRYRDSTQRKAVVNSMLAMFVKKTVDKPGSKPMGQAAVRKGTETSSNSLDDRPRRFNVAEGIPGVVIDELQQGEEPHGFASTGTDERFGGFEEAIIQAIAWANEIPPEILTLGFGSNYSASQAAINEFKIYISKVRATFGEQFCQPIYIEWLLSEVLQQKIKAPRLIESFRDAKLYDVFAAWTSCDWAGAIKVAVDLSKLVAGYKALVADGWITRDRAARELTGMKFSKVVQTLTAENKLLAKANQPLLALDPKVAVAEVMTGNDNIDYESDSDEEDSKSDARPTKLPVKRAS